MRGFDSTLKGSCRFRALHAFKFFRFFSELRARDAGVSAPASVLWAALHVTKL